MPAKTKGYVVASEGALRVVDLFSGAGGISEGFKQAGFQVVGGSDNDPDAAATYSLNFPHATVVVGDIRTRSVKRQILEMAAGADVIVGGPPCQAFSQVRNHSRMIDDPRNVLYREFVAVIRHVRPAAFVMENVTGMDQMGARDQIAQDLSLKGLYKVRPQVLDAADFGVPQTRKRLLFIGVREDLGIEPPVVSGTGATDSMTLARFTGTRKPKYQVVIQQNLFSMQAGKALADPEDITVVSVADAISDLSDLPVGNRNDNIPFGALSPARSAYQRLMRQGVGDVIANVQVPRINPDTVLRLKGIPPGGNHRDLSEDLLARYITGQKWGQDNGTGRLSRKHFYAYRRLHPAIWAWTLNTKADSAYHYEAGRALSVREFARLQSFPDKFVFTTDARRGPLPGRHDGGAAHSRYRQVGNAVPPLLAKAVGSNLLKLLMSTVGKEQERKAMNGKVGKRVG